MVAYIRRTFPPTMLASISKCVFSMILKYRTLYSMSKMSSNPEKLLMNDMSICPLSHLLCNGEIIARGSNCVHNVLQFILHVHYAVHGEMNIGIDSRLNNLSLCCIICSEIKKIRIFVAKPELLISCHPNERQSAVFPREPPRHQPVAG